MWKRNKKNVGLIIAVCLIGIITVELAGIYLSARKRQNDIFYYTDEMNREATIEALNNPLDIVQLVMMACKDQDLDKFVRGTAVQEMADGMNLEVNLLKGGIYLPDGFGLPSGDWNVYSPLNAAVYTGYSAQMYRRIMDEFANPADLRIISVDYLNTDYQASADNWEKVQTECSIWGADALATVSALVEYDGLYYRIIFDTLKYGESWKVKAANNLEVSMITKEQYDAEVNYNEESVELFEYGYAIAPRSEITEQTMLPLNYFLIDNKGSAKNAEMTIQKYFSYAKKSDMYGALSCFSLEKNTTEEWIAAQARNAQSTIVSMATIMDYRLIRGFNQLQETSRAAGTIVKALNPDQLMYLTCNSCMLNEKLSEEEVLYDADVLLNNIIIKNDVTLKEGENGWNISGMVTYIPIQ